MVEVADPRVVFEGVDTEALLGRLAEERMAAQEGAGVEAAGLREHDAFTALVNGYHQDLAAIWTPDSLPAYSTAELAKMHQARAEEAARVSAERFRPRNLFLAAGGLLTAATCTVGGAYAWLSNRAALRPSTETGSATDPHTVDPHLAYKMTVEPLREGLRAGVALTGEIGMGFGLAALTGAAAVALATRKSRQVRREARMTTVLEAAAQAARDEAVGHDGRTAPASPAPVEKTELSLRDEILSLHPRAKQRLRDRLRSTVQLAASLLRSPSAPALLEDELLTTPTEVDVRQPA